jgi:hypothetical protein
MGAVETMSISFLSISFQNAMSCAEFPHMTYPRPITLMTNVTIFLGITLTDMTTHGVLNMS